jgi:hypothetical protein
MVSPPREKKTKQNAVIIEDLVLGWLFGFTDGKVSLLGFLPLMQLVVPLLESSTVCFGLNVSHG